MELKSFADDNFDPKTWINKAWSASGNQDKEVFVANTVSRLQLYMKQLTNSLDETATQIVTSTPRVLQDAATLQDQCLSLQTTLLSLERRVMSVETDTGHSIQRLQRIDRLKATLESAASTLREADKWAALANSLEDMLEKGVPTQMDKINELTEQVGAMTGSLDILNEEPDYEEKRSQLDTLYNRLEAAITPPLIEGLTQMDSARVSTYASLLLAMRRPAILSRCWRRCVASVAAREWRASDSHALQPHKLLANIDEQMTWLTEVMKSEIPLQEIIRLYTDLLLSLDPSPSKIVISKLKLCQTPQEGIVYLIDVRIELDQMIDTFKKLIEAPRQVKETIPNQVLKDLTRSVYAALRDCLPRYTDLQTQAFNMIVDSAPLNQDDLLESSRAYQNLVERCESILKNAHTNARKIAGPAIYPYFLPAVEELASRLCSILSHGLRAIERKMRSSENYARSSGLSDIFPATGVFYASAGELLDILAGLVKKIRECMVLDEHQNPLLNTEFLLLDEKGRRNYETLKKCIDPIQCVNAIRRERNNLKKLSEDLLFEPARIELGKIPTLNVWSNNDALITDLPDYALSPQEYITEVGQYLMTLPQHLEMHLPEKQTPLQYLNQVCNQTCDVYAEKILSIKNMDTLGTKRCLTDIAYLSSVVDDLGSPITTSLANLEKSLRVTTGGD